jgi:hypothetical protein
MREVLELIRHHEGAVSLYNTQLPYVDRRFREKLLSHLEWELRIIGNLRKMIR